METLNLIRAKLTVPKTRFNEFSKFYYRNADDIMKALKPLLLEYDAHLGLTQDVVQIGDRFYVKTVATFQHEKFVSESTAFARESLTRKGMNDEMLTGASGSYSTKYALNNLFMLDDSNDADHESQAPIIEKKESESLLKEMLAQIAQIETDEYLVGFWTGRHAHFKSVLNAADYGAFQSAFSKRRGEIRKSTEALTAPSDGAVNASKAVAKPGPDESLYVDPVHWKPLTQKQSVLIQNLIKSHVFTDEEREGAKEFVSEMHDQKETASFIQGLTEAIKDRKAIEKEEQAGSGSGDFVYECNHCVRQMTFPHSVGHDSALMTCDCGRGEYKLIK